jgi:hypothetical protein
MGALVVAGAIQFVNLAKCVWFQRTALVRILALRHQIAVYKPASISAPVPLQPTQSNRLFRFGEPEELQSTSKLHHPGSGVS